MTDFKQDRAIYLQMAERICDEILAGKYNAEMTVFPVYENWPYCWKLILIPS